VLKMDKQTKMLDDPRISAQVMANYINQWMENEWSKSDRGDGYSIGEFYHDYLQTAIKAYLYGVHYMEVKI